MALTAEALRGSRDKLEALLDAHPVGDPLHDKYWRAYMSVVGKIATRSGEELEATVRKHKEQDEARRLRKETKTKIQAAARKVRGENRFQRPVIIAPPTRHYARRDDVIRNQLEAIQEQQQRGRLELERATRPPKEKVQTEARKRGRPKGTTKSYNLKSKIRDFASKERELAPPSEARWVDFGTLPEYKPPNFQLDKSGYKPLDYKPLETKPMFQYTGFKTMDYKPISSEPYYKASGVGDQPYYKKFEYRPIGQFGSVINNPPNISGLQSEPRKRKKKAKEPRIVGE